MKTSPVLFAARLFCLTTLLSALHSVHARPAEPATKQNVLANYVARADESFGWREVSSGRIGRAEYVEYLMKSQTWRGAEWKHQFFILRPDNATDASQALLFVHGGRWKPEYDVDKRPAQLPKEALLFVQLAESIRAPIGVLRQVPFGPQFDRSDDALIAYTFDQYLQTGDEDWPVLLPMVKSVVRAMDVMQAELTKRWHTPLAAFTVTGASKRGWTAWLTAAVDARVQAVAPMVIDVLNMEAQMAHQRATWGELSEEIGDYARLDIPARLSTERGNELLSIVDPFRYRDRLTKPKLILLSTNDRYWPLDALKLYWNELPEPKRVLYVPNQGHDLRDIDRVIGALSAAHRYAARDTPLPRLSWNATMTAKELSIRVETDRAPERVLVWHALSPSRDFRGASWTPQPCKQMSSGFVCAAPRAAQGYTAAYAEAAFKDEGAPQFSLSTTVCIAESKAAPAAC